MGINLIDKIVPKAAAFTGLVDESQIIREATTTVSSSTHTVATTDQKIAVDYTATGAVTITIDSDNTVDGRVFSITDTGGNAGTYNITIETEGTETINGETSAVMAADFESWTIFSDGSNYFVR